DGISVLIPLPFLNQLTPAPFEWLVPGLLANKILALLKGLPKTLRRPLVPLPQTQQFCLQQISAYGQDKPLGSVLGLILLRQYGLTIPGDAWRHEDLPEHLRINFKVIAENSDTLLAQGRDLRALQQEWGAVAKKQFSALPKSAFAQSGLTSWSFGNLPQQVVVAGERRNSFGFPAIHDDGQSVSLRLVEDADEARRISRWGLVRLFALQLAPLLQPLQKKWSLPRDLLGIDPAFGSGKGLWWECTALALAKIFLDGHAEEIENEEQFLQRLANGRPLVGQTILEMQQLIKEIALRQRAVQTVLAQGEIPGLPMVEGDIRSHLASLIYPGFLRETAPAWLKHYPRYLQGILLRLQRRAQAPLRDNQRAAELQPYWKRYLERAKQHAAARIQDPELAYYRWMVEELRISLFAQDLRTLFPVSGKRLEQQWEKILP
ncbi:DUF3418 domain-containing protein, partial [Candidatus Magnetaquicoccus inordinatus]|uniref:DUF3418 domain-containing protein n=1 Tax=Candidatus Magnetaquicoccus inordinatus TaxID=2496818 RepID=UPI00102B0129